MWIANTYEEIKVNDSSVFNGVGETNHWCFGLYLR